MNKIVSSPRSVFITVSIVIAAIARLLPHWPNFTPVAAIALFGGTCFSSKKLAFTIPLVIMLLSDLTLEMISGIGFHNTMIYVYIGFILITAIGVFTSNKLNVQRVGALSLFSSILFFTVTNFGVWAADGFTMGFNGLIEKYILGIPFFGYTVMGDLFYNTVLFGAFYFAQLKFPRLAKIESK